MGKTLFGLLGWPVSHSVSPAMMQAAFSELAIEGCYLPFPVRPEALADAVRGLQALGAVGVNVTIPHKQNVVPMLSLVTDEASRAGAVNTLKFDCESRAIIGHNTDVSGWWESLERRWPPRVQLRTVTLLGSGGAARAVLAALALHANHVHVRVTSRNRETTEELVRDFREVLELTPTVWEQREDSVAESDLVVQSTPMGMWPNVDDSPVIHAACFHPGQVVQDLVYRPLETRLLSQAREQGATVLDGLAMLVEQGALALEFWTGKRPSRQLMHAAALAALGHA